MVLCMQSKNYYIKQIKTTYFFAALAAFLIGIAIYVFYRNIDNLVLFRYFPKPSFLASLSLLHGTDTIGGYLFVFTLPHGLWCISGLFVIRAIWLHNTKWRAIYGVIFIIVVSSLEISQLSENRPGTFDILDLSSYFISAFLESIVFNIFVKRRIIK